jgi:hypothetical protein
MNKQMTRSKAAVNPRMSIQYINQNETKREMLEPRFLGNTMISEEVITYLNEELTENFQLE